MEKINKTRRNRFRKTRLIKQKKLYTVAEWINLWYKTYKENKHAQTTKQVQETYIRCHIIPNMGNMFIHNIKPHDVQAFLNTLLKEGNKSKLKHSDSQGKPLAAWTVKKIRALLLASFEIAVRDGLIEENPVRKTEPIIVQTLQVAYFTPNQQNIFLQGTTRHRFHVAYQLLFYTGCRRSEILGLTWDCIDMDMNQIHIRKVLVNINGQAYLKNYPKTKTSVRTIPLHPMIIKMLKEHQRKQHIEAKNNTSWNNCHNLVFCNKDGSPHSPTYFLHNFKNAIRRLGLPKNLRVHSTRHTFATNLLQLGVSIADVQHLGGWSDTRVVLEIYSHTVKESHRTAVQKLFETNQSRTKLPRKRKN